MADQARFWSGGRRRFIARILSTLGILLVGALVTSEVLEKLSLGLKWVICAGAVMAVMSAVLVWSDDEGPEDTSKED